MKSLSNINRIQMTNEVIMLLLSLYESKGKSFYYDDLFSRDQLVFARKTQETDLFYLAKIHELDMTEARMKLFAKKDMKARTKDEYLFNNIKKAYMQLKQHPEDFELLVNEVGNLIKLLSYQYENISFNTYESLDDGMLKMKKHSKKEDLEKVFYLYEKLIKEKNAAITQLIINFYVDLMNIDICNKKNDLISMILFYALVIKDFSVFKYVSFFKHFYKIKDVWHQSMVTASYYWHEGFAQTDMIHRMFIKILIDSYKELDQFVHEYQFEKGLNKSDNLENSILKMKDIFSKNDLRKRHPNVSDATIDRTLKRLKEEDKIRPLGKGRSSKWQRIVEGRQKLSTAQLSLFDD